MKALAFVKSLLPNFSKDHVVEDARITRGELTEATIPAYKNAVLSLKGYDYKSAEIKEMFKLFNRNVAGSKDVIGTILEGLGETVENLEVVEKQIVKTYADEIATAGMSYRKANLLQFVELSSFVSKYARKFVFYIFVVESSQFAENGLEASESMSLAEVTWIKENFMNFVTAFNAVTMRRDKVLKSIEDIPDIVITDDNEDTLSQGGGAARIDPFSMRFIPTWLNPFYHLGMHFAEWQANRYKVAKEELACLQLRRLHLEKLKTGKTDPALEKQIAHMESRIQGLNYKISELEKSVK